MRGADIPNLVPEHGSGLLDALTLDYGPREVIVPLMLRANMVMRAIGIRVRIRHDFPALVEHNERELAKGQQGNWFRLVNMLLPEAGATAENAYWLSGETRDGEIAFTLAGRVYDWPETTLHDEARLMFYGGRELGQQCVVTAASAKTIGGVVNCGAGCGSGPITASCGSRRSSAASAAPTSPRAGPSTIASSCASPMSIRASSPPTAIRPRIAASSSRDLPGAISIWRSRR